LDGDHDSPVVEDDSDIAASELSEPGETTVERDVRRPVDRESHPCTVELTEHEPGWSHPDDETAIDCLVCRCTRRRKHERDAEHQAEPSHDRILGDLRQSRVCSV
jgi:hypothetical protein